jgi:vacuolar-type H+-ATPase subunit I/STV1
MQTKPPDFIDIYQTITNRTKEVIEKMRQQNPSQMTAFTQALNAWPIFGGTTTTDITPPVTAEGQAAQQAITQSQQEQQPPETEQKPDPVAQLQADPNALGQLLKQVEKLQGDLSKVTTERDGYAQKQQEEQRKTQTREEQLQTDLNTANETIQKMDRVIRNTALINAFLSQSDFQWNSIRQALTELNEDEIEIDVNLDGGEATVTGMENAVKRIAQSSPWLLKAGATQDKKPPLAPQRGSGKPPAPPAGNESKQSKRADLMKKFPVIAHGRKM